MNHPIMAQIEDQIKALGFQRVGMTSLEPAISLRQYEEWLAKDYHGDMTYLQTHLAHKTSPSNLVPRAISALVVSCNYFPEVPGSTDLPLKPTESPFTPEARTTIIGSRNAWRLFARVSARCIRIRCFGRPLTRLHCSRGTWPTGPDWGGLAKTPA